MGNLIFNTIFWTLAFYGLFEIVKNILYTATYTHLKSEGIYLILAVKNQEDKVEGIIRSILFRIIYGKDEFLKSIIVSDLKSKDSTKEILKKISEENEIIKYMCWKECKEIIDNIDEI